MKRGNDIEELKTRAQRRIYLRRNSAPVTTVNATHDRLVSTPAPRDAAGDTEDSMPSAQRDFLPASPSRKRKHGEHMPRDESQKNKRSRRSTSDKERRKDNLVDIANRVLSARQLTPEELTAMQNGQGYCFDPRLGLAYFHCCSQHPDAFVFNDEMVSPDASGNETACVQRLLRVLDEPPGQNEAVTCQKSIEAHVVHTTIDELSELFHATSQEREERYGGLDDATLRLHCQVYQQGEYLLSINPDLVVDGDRVVQCDPCALNPRQVPYSIASGHDYGRRGDLPVLNEISSNSICPVRRFGLEISLSGKHMTGHVICFASDGPVQCTKSLPRTDSDSMPHVTFIGPKEKWRIQKRKFSQFFYLPEDDIYRWLAVLSRTHSYWRREEIVVDDSCHRRAAVRDLKHSIQQHVVIVASETSERLVDAVCSGPTGDSGGGEADSSNILLEKAAMLRGNSITGCVRQNEVVEAMLESLPGGKCLQRSEEDGDVGTRNCVNPDEKVFAITREATPIVEWDSNGYLLAGAFPTLFMRGGDMLPKGTVPKVLADHFFRYYDGRFEQDVMFVATLFNQRQRHAAVQKAARVATTHSAVLRKLGRLANNPDFRKRLESARKDPTSQATKQLNSQLLRMLSIVGEKVPFSPFELAAARPKLSALSHRYGLAHHWVTLVPPEQDDLRLLRIAQLRKDQVWNRLDNIYTRGSCEWCDLLSDLQQDSRKRLTISAMYPALAAIAFTERFTATQQDILQCENSQMTRLSHDYSDLKAGAYGKVAAFGAVVEPQRGGRLHAHIAIYGSTWSPSVLTRIIPSPILCEKAKRWLDAVSQTHLSPQVHDYLDRCHQNNPVNMWATALQRPCQISIPSAETSPQSFYETAQKCMAATNIHRHSSTCVKGLRGRYMCRLNRPSGIWDNATSPIQLIVKSRGDLTKGIKGTITSHRIEKPTCDLIDSGYDIGKGELLRPHLSYPITWEQHRPEIDASVVETNLTLAILTGSHTNSSVLATEDAGEFVD
ncbi:Helitron helicase-like domain-containing protein [Phytophthora infestans]|uniref:Helitron helicase-like domain at N-terminus n=1 Tax=Phytophthora infestans TaxID=4787 RepID=A0A833WL15_PHYIN|nr:Helitron helicase-like domain-containing protein [Phytophthora infestans]KAF4138557.1 Helitron helicase-like domain at N-terminus [Phytophthora infestans]